MLMFYKAYWHKHFKFILFVRFCLFTCIMPVAGIKKKEIIALKIMSSTDFRPFAYIFWCILFGDICVLFPKKQDILEECLL